MAETKEKSTCDVQEAVRFAEMYSALPAEKRAAVVAFINGMEAQKALDATELEAAV